MTLRSEIQEIINSSAGSAEASIKILKYLDETIGLDGNGWFDDDPDFQKLIREDDQLEEDA